MKIECWDCGEYIDLEQHAYIMAKRTGGTKRFYCVTCIKQMIGKDAESEMLYD